MTSKISQLCSNPILSTTQGRGSNLYPSIAPQILLKVVNSLLEHSYFDELYELLIL